MRRIRITVFSSGTCAKSKVGSEFLIHFLLVLFGDRKAPSIEAADCGPEGAGEGEAAAAAALWFDGYGLVLARNSRRSSLAMSFKAPDDGAEGAPVDDANCAMSNSFADSPGRT